MNEITVPEKEVAKVSLWSRIKKRKKLVILLLLVLILVIAGLLFTGKLRKSKSSGSTYSFIRTTTLADGSLSDTVSATGTVESREISTVSYTGESGTKTPKVKEILVAVGDVVKEGDVIVRLDTSDLLEDIEKAEEDLEEAQDSAWDSYTEISDTYTTAKSNAAAQKTVADAAYAAMNTAYEPYSQALNSISSYQAAYDNSVTAWYAAGVAYNNALTAGEGVAEAETALNDAVATMNAAAAQLQSVKNNCNFDALERTYSNAKSTYEKEYSSYEQIVEQKNNAYDRLQSASKTLDKTESSDTLDNLYSSLAACNLKAATGGTVTSLNATIGSSPTGSVAVIQDLNSLKVSISISEADINKVEVGMTCVITSDATDGNIKGTLTQIDPISGASGSFGAEVTVDDENTGLRAGMNASVQIILSQSNEGFKVPADALGNDNDGLGDYVYRKTGGEGVDMTFEKVYVSTGNSNDYYIQIMSDTLSYGDVIRSSSDLSQGIETVEEEEISGFNLGSLFGGMGGNNMPSGDFPGGDFPSGNMPNGGSNGNMPSGSSGGNMPSGDFSGGGMPGGMR